MLRILAGGAAMLALGAAAQALTPEETMTNACIEAGNEPSQCTCAVGLMSDELTEAELAFMVEMMESEDNTPPAVMAAAEEHGLSQEQLMSIGQRMGAMEPQMREQCGIEESD